MIKGFYKKCMLLIVLGCGLVGSVGCGALGGLKNIVFSAAPTATPKGAPVSVPVASVNSNNSDNYKFMITVGLIALTFEGIHYFVDRAMEPHKETSKKYLDLFKRLVSGAGAAAVVFIAPSILQLGQSVLNAFKIGNCFGCGSAKMEKS